MLNSFHFGVYQTKTNQKKKKKKKWRTHDETLSYSYDVCQCYKIYKVSRR